ncbi:MAG: TRAP transporter permease [Hyphomicrobiaceae bacterium]|nr:TRAP transporter permease [Hyphomicrobiaceae bacterium]
MTIDSVSEHKARQLEAELDPEMSFRRLSPSAEMLVGGLLFTLSVFHYYTAGFGLLREEVHRGVHLAFVAGLIFLVFPMLKRGGSAPRSSLMRPGGVSLLDWMLAVSAAVTSLYMPWVFHDLADRIGNPTTLDVAMGTVLIVVLIEATRRSIGWGLPMIALLSMAYALFGRHFPGILLHPGSSWSNLVNHLYLTSQGIYGVALGVVATYVFHFVLFGVLATKVGLGRLFLGVAAAVAGRFAGGPAKISIFGSALFGMISGSSVANTVTVGSLTIPMMVRLGYQRHFAAAVESTAATGGQITPPIMGAAAFLMVEFLEMPYATIVIAAIVPAFMHFFGVLCQVHFEAKKNGMRGLEPGEIPRLREVLARDWPTLAPLVALILILFSGYTPYLAAFWGITGCLLMGLAANRNAAGVLFAVTLGLAAPMGLLRETLTVGPFSASWNAVMFAGAGLIMLHGALSRSDGWRQVHDMVDAFIVGAKYAIAVGAAAATVGIIVGVVTLTGVGFKISFIVTSLAAQAAGAIVSLAPFALEPAGLTLFFTLVLTAIVCILLGCGVPTTATYIIMVTVAAPALALLGVPALVAHYFVFYWGVLADITPPVAIAAYAGASMAGADPFRTGNTAFRLALGKILVPFVFVFSPSMLLMVPGFSWNELATSVVGCILGIVALSAAFTGYALAPMAVWERLLLAAAALPMVAPSWTATLGGVILAAPVILRQLAASRSGQTRSVET